ATLIVGCFLVLRPFLTAVLWAAILCATTWPLYERLRRRFHRHEWLAATIMLAMITMVLFAPFVIVGLSVADNANAVEQWARALIAAGPPDPPAWVAELPLIGASAAGYWAGMAHDTAAMMAELRKYIEPARKVALASGATIAAALLQLGLSILIAFFIFRDAEDITGRLRGGLSRLAGERGSHLAFVAIATVRGVVLGILGTAIVQGVLAGLGFWIAGIKAAPLLGFVTFQLSPVPVGPPLVWLPAGLWLLNIGETGWGIFVLAWGALVVSTIDNILRPLIISQGSDLPFVLVLLGVLGGVVAFGFIGVFLGPVLLALGYALLNEWAAHTPAPGEDAAKVKQDEA
ncbi:MAG: AI-2E family transporter, partial [Betaproteobacteria bacterium]